MNENIAGAYIVQPVVTKWAHDPSRQIFPGIHVPAHWCVYLGVHVLTFDSLADMRTFAAAINAAADEMDRRTPIQDEGEDPDRVEGDVALQAAADAGTGGLRRSGDGSAGQDCGDTARELTSATDGVRASDRPGTTVGARS